MSSRFRFPSKYEIDLHQNIANGFGDRLKAVRREIGLTQRELAEMARMDVERVSVIEAGLDLSMTPDEMRRLALALGR